MCVYECCEASWGPCALCVCDCVWMSAAQWKCVSELMLLSVSCRRQAAKKQQLGNKQMHDRKEVCVCVCLRACLDIK